MSLVFTIDDITINNSDVLDFPQTAETVTLSGASSNLFPSELELKLDNVSGDYDDRDSGTLFFGTSWYNSDLTIYDDVTESYIWKGRVKSFNLNQYEKIVTVRSVNLIQDIAETTLVYNSTSSTTPAEHIYNIIVDEVGISTDNLNLASFNEAIAIQDNNSVYVNITFTASDDKKALPVISELCRMTQCELYTEDNKLYLYQYQVYNSELGELIEDKNLIADSSYKHYFDEKIIVNSYSIKYDNSGTIATATGSDATSQTTFGVRAFNIPNESLDSTTSSEYKILFKSSGAATWAGDLAIDRYQSLTKYFEINTGSELDTIKLNSQVDLSFDGMSREPGRIVEKNYNTETETIFFKGYYLNTPYQHVARDTTPPEVPEIIDVFSLADGSLIIKFTKNFETDFIGYKLYFTATPGVWENDFSNQGASPIDIKNPDTTLDGYYYYQITGLSNSTNYYFKMKSYDNRFNMSAFSNVAECTPYIDSTENKYMLTGNIISGLTLDDSNPGGGSAISGLSVYGTALYGTGTYTYAAIYQTTFYDVGGLSSIVFQGFTESGVIYYQYDQSSDGSTWDGWSAITDANGIKSIALTKNYAQVRFLFGPLTWLDSDYILIREVN
jgi:hypothetical protein